MAYPKIKKEKEMTFWRNDNVNCVLVKWSKSLPEEGKPFEKAKSKHMVCFGDFKI